MATSFFVVTIFLLINAQLIVSFNDHLGDGVSWWQSASDFIPQHGTQYGSLELRNGMYMEFDIVNHGPTPSTWLNVFRIGFASSLNTCNSHMSRYPSLWMLPDEDKWHFSISQHGDCDKHWGHWGSYPSAQLDTAYHMKINYNSSRVFISINGVIYVDEPRNGTMPELLGETVYIWMSTDEWSYTIPAANVTMSNIHIQTYWDNESYSLPPTQPTVSPSVPTFSAPTTMAPSAPSPSATTKSPTTSVAEDPKVPEVPSSTNDQIEETSTTSEDGKESSAALPDLFDLGMSAGMMFVVILMITALTVGCTCFCLGYYCAKSKQLQTELKEEAERKQLMEKEIETRQSNLADL